ncbi:hypothetical protein C8Q76DRAFT_728203, partial [Earliella scabrosa]
MCMPPSIHEPPPPPPGAHVPRRFSSLLPASRPCPPSAVWHLRRSRSRSLGLVPCSTSSSSLLSVGLRRWMPEFAFGRGSSWQTRLRCHRPGTELDVLTVLAGRPCGDADGSPELRAGSKFWICAAPAWDAKWVLPYSDAVGFAAEYVRTYLSQVLSNFEARRSELGCQNYITYCILSTLLTWRDRTVSAHCLSYLGLHDASYLKPSDSRNYLYMTAANERHPESEMSSVDEL